MIDKYSAEFFKKSGSVGGKTFAKKYTKKQRSEIAKKRWAKIRARLDKNAIHTI